MTTGMTTQEALAVFNLPAGAEQGEVTRTYRALIRTAHPDLATDDEDRKRREQYATQINVAFKTLQSFGTSPLPNPSPEPEADASADAPGPTRDSREPDFSVRPETPVSQQRQPSEQTVPIETVPKSPELFFDPVMLWYGLFLALRALPFILLGAVLRWLSFWERFHSVDPETAFSPGGTSVCVIIGASFVVIIAIGALGGRRLSTIALVIATVIYGSFTEALSDLSNLQNVLLTAVIVVGPLARIFWPRIRRLCVRLSTTGG